MHLNSYILTYYLFLNFRMNWWAIFLNKNVDKSHLNICICINMSDNSCIEVYCTNFPFPMLEVRAAIEGLECQVTVTYTKAMVCMLVELPLWHLGNSDVNACVFKISLQLWLSTAQYQNAYYYRCRYSAELQQQMYYEYMMKRSMPSN